MEMTGNIQTLIDDMTGLSESVLAECNTSKQNISDGMDSMDELTDNSNRLNDSSARVIESMKNLQEKASQWLRTRLRSCPSRQVMRLHR